MFAVDGSVVGLCKGLNTLHRIASSRIVLLRIICVVLYCIASYRIAPDRVVFYRIVLHRIHDLLIVSLHTVSHQIASYRIVSDRIATCEVAKSKDIPTGGSTHWRIYPTGGLKTTKCASLSCIVSSSLFNAQHVCGRTFRVG